MAVLPVIHLRDVELAVSEALVAARAGAEGVFLIDHSASPDPNHVLRAHTAVVEASLAANAPIFVGVNFLGMTAEWSFSAARSHRPYGIEGVWCDPEARQVVKAHPTDGPWGPNAGVYDLYFASVAFKGQPQPESLELAARLAMVRGADVLTTSGPATGQPCDPEKMRRLRAVAGPLMGVGVASGVAVDNVGGLIDAGADALLVASSIAHEGDFHRMDEGRLRELVQEVRGHVARRQRLLFAEDS